MNKLFQLAVGWFDQLILYLYQNCLISHFAKHPVIFSMVCFYWDKSSQAIELESVEVNFKGKVKNRKYNGIRKMKEKGDDYPYSGGEGDHLHPTRVNN